MREYDVCIVGGGAAGLAAAALLKKELRVCILEKNEILGRKLAATGGGRCNLTNRACSGKDATLDFFASIGIETYCDEEGRYYPYTNRAADVIKALTDAATAGKGDAETAEKGDAAGAAVFCNSAVTDVTKEDGRFVIKTAKDSFTADCLILATGGKAAPQYGTTGDGYGIARSLGHTVGRVYPILTPVECGGVDFQKLKGIRAKAQVSLYRDGVPVEGAPKETGEVQFTDDGLSGICVFNLTPFIKAEEGESVSDAIARYSITADFAPDFTAGDLQERTSSFGILTGALAEIADEQMADAGCGAAFIKDWRFPVKSVKGWRYAQCTAGGVDTAEIDMETMESKLVPRLYVTGELLDEQGPCGGFNLQNAWETAMKAAEAINGKDR